MGMLTRMLTTRVSSRAAQLIEFLITITITDATKTPAPAIFKSYVHYGTQLTPRTNSTNIGNSDRWTSQPYAKEKIQRDFERTKQNMIMYFCLAIDTGH